MGLWRVVVLAIVASLGMSLLPAPIGPAAQAALPAAAPAKPRVMVVGDSISQGLEGDYTWRYRLSQSLARSGTAVDLVGPWTGTHALSAPAHSGRYRPGINFDKDNLAQWGWQMHQAKDVIGTHVATYKPDYLLVELGFNDLGWGVNGPAGVLNDFEWLVSSARARNPSITILVANVPQRSALSNLPNLPATIADYNRLLAARVPQLTSAASRIVLVDVDGPYNHAVDSYDGLHPNVRGEHVIAKAFADRLAGVGLGKAFGKLPTTLPANLTPAAPTSITATATGEDIRVSWTHAFGAAGYRFYSRDATAGGAFKAGVYDIGADTWTAGLLPAGHRMEFYVQAVRGGHASKASPTAKATAATLGQVTGLKATTDPLRPYTVKLTWKPVAGAKDYSVYAAPGCDVLPPVAKAYRLQQWGLGTGTTWTQQLVTAPCTNYIVVASRYGGEGQRPGTGVRAWPYQNNYFHLLARNRYVLNSPDAGDQRATTSVAAGTDRGVVVVRGFIRNKDDFTEAIGDHRHFGMSPYASSKIGVAWDTSTGEVGVYVHKSCALGSDLPGGPFEIGCRDAYPIRFVSDAATPEYGDSNHLLNNYVSVSLSSTGVLKVTVSALNAWSTASKPGSITDFGRINATVTLTPVAGGYRAVLLGDKFPAWEIYRYPRTGIAPAGSFGVTRTIGTRDQTQILNLRFGSPSTCFSRPPENATGQTHPMRC